MDKPASRQVAKPPSLPYRSKRNNPRKRGPVVRVLLMLMDGEWHTLGDFYDFVAGSINPQIAARAYLRRFENREDQVQNNPQEALDEGVRVILNASLSQLELGGKIEVIRPEPESRHPKGTRGFYDLRKVRLRITPAGVNHVLTGHGIWAKLVAELYLGLEAGKLTLNVTAK